MQNMEHIYFEVGTSLLAKPQALSDLIELEAGHSVLVFCNSPSDADFADVILRKRGVASVKLIGYVPQIKLSKAIQQVQKGEITALVLTDVAARGVSLGEFDVVLNYSVPTDPEIYFHRYASEVTPETVCKTKKVLSLVAAADLSNFHFLNKLGKVEFIKEELPTPEKIFVNKFVKLREQAMEKAQIASDPGLNELVNKITSDANVREIVALLLHNTLTVIPALNAAIQPAREDRDESEDSDDMNDGDNDRRNFGHRDQGGRERRVDRFANCEQSIRCG